MNQTPVNSPEVTQVVLAGDCADADRFYVAFGTSAAEHLLFRPLFLALATSKCGELSTSFGLFDRDNHLYEVSGSECSAWNMIGQFNFESTSVQSILHRAEKGEIGLTESGIDIYRSRLVEFLRMIEDVYAAGEMSVGEKFRLADPVQPIDPGHPLLAPVAEVRDILIDYYQQSSIAADALLANHAVLDEGPTTVIRRTVDGIDYFLAVGLDRCWTYAYVPPALKAGIAEQEIRMQMHDILESMKRRVAARIDSAPHDHQPAPPQESRDA